jgi:hypothetical protein
MSRSARGPPLSDTDVPLHEHLSELDATLTTLSQDNGLDANDPRNREILLDQMSQIVSLPGGAEALVARYGGDERVVVIRPLAFLLAGAVNNQDGAHRLAATVFAMIGNLQTDDPWPRLNLCTAVQRILMFEAIASLEVPVASALAGFLRESLAGPPLLRATAATVVADLFYRERTDLVPAADLVILRTMVLNLCDDADELTRNEAQGLRDFLNKTPSTNER